MCSRTPWNPIWHPSSDSSAPRDMLGPKYRQDLFAVAVCLTVGNSRCEGVSVHGETQVSGGLRKLYGKQVTVGTPWGTFS
jgi:hypothetical protein